MVSVNGTTSINTPEDSIDDRYEPYDTFPLSLLSSEDNSKHWANTTVKSECVELHCNNQKNIYFLL